MMNFDSTSITTVGLARMNRILGELEVIPVSRVKYEEISDVILDHITSDFHPDSMAYAFDDRLGDACMSKMKTFFAGDIALDRLMTELSHDLSRCSSHHLIKKGDLIGFYLKDIIMDDELIEGLLIAKIDPNTSFLQVQHESDLSIISKEMGTAVGKLEKACLILNTDEDDGYQIYLSTATGKQEAKYWKDEFLGISPSEASYAPTEQYMDMAKTFIKQHVYQEDATNQVEKHGVLFDAGEFFKGREQYDNHSWEKEVLGEKPERIEAWAQHKEDYAKDTGVSLPESFGISNKAVQQHARYFKSVLKLDKNFHVYIHGDRQKIQHGVEPDGRKFYKLYYDEEK